MRRESSTVRLIIKRTQRLADARENLKDRLHLHRAAVGTQVAPACKHGLPHVR